MVLELIRDNLVINDLTADHIGFVRERLIGSILRVFWDVFNVNELLLIIMSLFSLCLL